MRILTSLILLLFVGTAAIADENTEALDGAGHYQKGVELMDGGGDLDTATTHFESAGELGFQPVGVAYRLARIYARTGRNDEALEQMEVLASSGFGVINLIDGEQDFSGIADQPRFVAAADTIRAARFPCQAKEEHHAFDFWVGEWDVSSNGQPAGTNNIQPILGHCVIFEQWTSSSGSEGKSFNYYDPGYDHWRQIWISDSGTVIEFTGEARDGGIFYTAETVNPADGTVTHHKFEFTQNEDASVRQFWATSTDNKETFSTIWDGHYEKR
ncbi:MAG: tetratricopeptide repeat protein [Woeseiaceae bacterium]